MAGLTCQGVSYRVQGVHGVSTPALAAGAARAALAAARLEPASVGLVVVGTTSPDVLWPSTACLVQTELGLPRVGCFDLYAAEAGLVTALGVADRYVCTDVGAALVIGAESDNQLVDLPGQKVPRARAAAALVLQRSIGDGDAGVLATVIGGAAGGRDTIRSGLSQTIAVCLQRAGVGLDEVDLIVGEQSAPEIMLAYARDQAVPSARLLLEPDRYRGTLTVAPLLALRDAVSDGRLRTGMLALLVSCGRGPAWAAACLRWGGAGIQSW